MASRRQRVHALEDFSGGLHLGLRQHELEDNESPNLLNVDIGERGGIRLRRGVDLYGDEFSSAAVDRLYAFDRYGGSAQLIASADADLWYGTGGSWTSMTGGGGFTAGSDMVTMDNLLYVVNLSEDSHSWDGSTWTSLGVSWNEDIGSGPSGNMPVAKHCETWKGCMWLAHTDESSVEYPNRIRWSHPGEPERWREDDWIDIDSGTDGDIITALVAMDDRLLVFKEKSIHMVVGDPPDGFAVYELTRELGVRSAEAVVRSPMGVHFFDWPRGLYFFDGKKIEWQFEKVYPLIDHSLITESAADGISVGYINQRVWVSVPMDGATMNSHTLVLDPYLHKGQAWTMYDLGLCAFLEFNTPSTTSIQYLASDCNSERVLALEQDRANDRFDGSTETHIDSYYQTAWVDMGAPLIRKRFKRGEAVMRGSDGALLRTEVYRDYNMAELHRIVDFTTEAVGAGGVWDTAVWDTDLWGAGSANDQILVKCAPLGNGRSMSLKILGPTTNTDWSINVLSLRYAPKPLRS